MADDTHDAPAAAAPKPKKSKKLLIIALVVILAGVGGGVYAMRRPASTEPAPTKRALVAFDPFVVNLADPGGMRFLRVTLQLVVSDEKVATKLPEEPVTFKEARSVILEILSQQQAAPLVTVEGKQALKKAIIERLSKVITDTKVLDVFFSEFVVQF